MSNGAESNELQKVTCWDAITMRVPAHWSCGQNHGGMWCCYEPDGKSGTLWVDYEVFDVGDADNTGHVARLRHIIDLFAQEVVADFSSREDGRVGEQVEVPDGLVQRLEEEGEEDGNRFRVFRWNYFKAVEGKVMTAFFSLVLPFERSGESAFRDLVAVIDREVQAAELRNPIVGKPS